MFFSVLALIFLCPLLIPIICILKLTGEGEVLYIQERVGQDGKVFGLLKFTTMIKNSPNIGAGDITISDDPRVLPFGKFLRKTKINELPQLLNIFFGHIFCCLRFFGLTAGRVGSSFFSPKKWML